MVYKDLLTKAYSYFGFLINMVKRFLEKIKKHFEEILKIRSSPSSIAFGFAIGTAIAILPTFGLGILIGLMIILIFKKINKISMLIAFAIWNPFLLIPLAAVSYKIGDMIFVGAPVYNYKFWILNQIFTYSRKFLLGNIILTISISVLSYFIVFFSVRFYQKNHPIEKIKEYVEEVVEDVKEAIEEVKEVIEEVK